MSPPGSSYLLPPTSYLLPPRRESASRAVLHEVVLVRAFRLLLPATGLRDSGTQGLNVIGTKALLTAAKPTGKTQGPEDMFSEGHLKGSNNSSS
jgi:hypothetical protein